MTIYHIFQRMSRTLLLAAGLLLVSQTAQAQVCTTSAIAPVFGNYSSSSPGNNANGSVTVTCIVLGVLGQDVNYTVKFGMSANAQGTQRRMASGTSRINYNVYCDNAYNTIWGDGTSSTCTNTGGQNGLIGQLLTIFPVYGRIPGGQYVLPGAYNDSIAITVLY